MILHTIPHKHGATAWSKNGLDWYYNSSVIAFPKYFTLLNGTQIQLARRERHQILLDDNGWPMYLFNGVEEVGSVNGFTYTGVQPINNSVKSR